MSSLHVRTCGVSHVFVLVCVFWSPSYIWESRVQARDVDTLLCQHTGGGICTVGVLGGVGAVYIRGLKTLYLPGGTQKSSGRKTRNSFATYKESA